ncbi:hypothetical protein AJ80_07925 [Polytolypa hystricis UAMH7299]|uniref:F-box domain-containing protein n=1 Tax=Polytolypa hystricis (strain UAMH7299) TaxID=1447883 RepID=A0A2B7X8F0_POLH7|nr:hypothetical protein AJ80_07925 [Polytolypa hystricis UAMH7299]
MALTLSETIQHIASFAPSDRDLCNMAHTCQQLRLAINPPHSGVWRSRFLRLYDLPPPNKDSKGLKDEYQFRSIMVTIIPTFKTRGGARHEHLWLNFLMSLISESYNRLGAPSNKPTGASRNLLRIKECVIGCDFFSLALPGKTPSPVEAFTEVFLGIQLILSHLALDLGLNLRTFRTDYDIATVYEYGGPPRTLVVDGEIYLDRLMQIRNFWKRHLTSKDEDSYYSQYKKLPEKEKPKAWNASLYREEKMGTKWVGFVASLDPWPENLEFLIERQCDATEGEEPLVWILDFTTDGGYGKETWTPLFNTVYSINTEVFESERRYIHGTQKVHNSTTTTTTTATATATATTDDTPGGGGVLRGFIELCQDHAGLPGWKRICFIVYTLRSFNGEEDELKLIPADWTEDFESATAYEGVIIPGGKIILGSRMRLFAATDEEEAPFIFWEV